MAYNYWSSYINDQKQNSHNNAILAIQQAVRSNNWEPVLALDIPSAKDHLTVSDSKIQHLLQLFSTAPWPYMTMDQAKGYWNRQRQQILDSYLATLPNFSDSNMATYNHLYKSLQIEPTTTDQNGVTKAYDLNTRDYSIVCIYEKKIVLDNFKDSICYGAASSSINIYRTTINVLKLVETLGLTPLQVAKILLLILDTELPKYSSVLAEDKQSISPDVVFRDIIKIITSNMDIQKIEAALANVKRGTKTSIAVTMTTYEKLFLELLALKMPFTSREELQRKTETRLKHILKQFVEKTTRDEVEALIQKWNETGRSFTSSDLISFVQYCEERENCKLKTVKSISVTEKILESQAYHAQACGKDTSVEQTNVGHTTTELQSTDYNDTYMSQAGHINHGQTGAPAGVPHGARGRGESVPQSRGRVNMRNMRGGRGRATGTYHRTTFYSNNVRGQRGSYRSRGRDRSRPRMMRNRDRSTPRSRLASRSSSRTRSTSRDGRRSFFSSQLSTCVTCGTKCGNTNNSTCYIMPNAIKSNEACSLCKTGGKHKPSTSCVDFHLARHNNRRGN